MKAQHKATTRRISAKDREFERLLRRAALYFKMQGARNALARKRRVAAA